MTKTQRDGCTCGGELAPLNDYGTVTQHDCCMTCGKVYPNNATTRREGE